MQVPKEDSHRCKWAVGVHGVASCTQCTHPQHHYYTFDVQGKQLMRPGGQASSDTEASRSVCTEGVCALLQCSAPMNVRHEL